jgi:diguanylate cyclase (GGDEF)-like protein
MARTWGRGWIAGVAVGAVACGLLLVLPQDSPAWVATTRGTSIVATIVFLIAAIRMPPGVRVVWWFMWLYQCLTVVGDLVYDVQQYHFDVSPFPGAADVLYLLAYSCALMGLVILIRSVHRGRDREAWIDAMIMTMAAASAVGTFVLVPSVDTGTPSDIGTVVALAYPLLDLLVISGLIRLMVGGGHVNASLMLLASSFGVYLTADLSYNYLVNNEASASVPGWNEALFLGGIVLLSAAATAPGATTIMTPSPANGRRTSGPRLIGLSVGALTAPVLLAYAAWNFGGLAERLLTVTSVVVIALVLWRVRILVATIEQQAEKLGEQARTDALTGLPNRRTWSYELDRVSHATLDAGEPLTLAMLDLDHFKEYNDLHGHPVADELLAACARAWSALLGPPHFLARYGGEEFAVLLPGVPASEAADLLDRVRQATPGGQTVSIGIAERNPLESAQAAMDRADHALYTAKDAGRNRVIVAG